MSSPLEPVDRIARDLRTPAAAGIAGVIFAGILLAVLVLMHSSVPAGPGSAEWLADSDRRRAVQLAVALIPFAGISFLWFIGVIRSRLGAREDKLFATVFLGSGLLFVGLLFTTAAFLGTALVLYDRGVGVSADAMLTLQVLARQLMGLFGARMAAVFAFSVSSVALRMGLFPRWLVAVGYVSAVVLLLSPPLSQWAQVVFPGWVLLVSLHVLAASRRAG
jgi:hypothetical protein